MDRPKPWRLTEKGKARRRAWYKTPKGRDYARSRAKQYHAKHKTRISEQRSLKRATDLGVDLTHVTPRPDNCEACGSALKVCLDHCHEKNVFRGWLCSRCNLALAYVNDDPLVLTALVEYLTKGSSK